MTDILSMQLAGADKTANLFKRFQWKLAASRWAATTAPMLADAIKHEVPVVNGTLRDATKVTTSISGMGAKLVYSAPGVAYAPFVVHGTKPHEIWPRNAMMLHWQDNHTDVFAHMVNHPGTKPNDYPLRAGRRVLARMAEELASKVKTTLEKG